ncbi:hypothetical protein Syun_023571 [Stephania yunnanensis]|uniref:EF-hand domain-containing protein n=1 Tax=Stephania yunnanensis TaxID=152371 RepID=A0AAP0F966_9MAGN
MEKTSSNVHSPTSSVATLLEVFLFDGILRWVMSRFHNSCSKFKFFLQSHVLIEKSRWGFELNSSSSNELFLSPKSSCVEKAAVEDDGKIRREDAEMVMGNLKIFCDPDGERLQERIGNDEISAMFEEKEPSLEEIKGAFDVFDVNGNGFFKEAELQRVLSALGFQEEAEMENCKSMIRAFDKNGDGRIDFTEFVKLMERSFC